MTIIEILAREDGSHNIQSRHGAARVWEDGYIEVPSHLEAAVWATCGWCDLHIEEGRLVGVTPTERPPEPEPEPEKDTAFPVGNLLMVAAVALVGGGAAYYFKVYRPKHEAAGLDEDNYNYDEADPYGDMETEEETEDEE